MMPLSWGKGIETMPDEKETEYIVLNCERCGKPLLKLHRELLRRIYEALQYKQDQHPHFYHPNCKGGLE